MSDERLHLSADRAGELLAPWPLDELTWSRAIKLLRDQPEMQNYLPTGAFAVDPRSGAATLFNPKRASRPHDNAPEPAKEEPAERSCVICEGHTTPIVDRRDLSEGFTFTNENLYPIVSPLPGGDDSQPQRTAGDRAVGLHFVQWTSSYHDVDWPELDRRDRLRVVDRLAALERRLLELADFPYEERYVSIIKNMGSAVGGSLSHPHQQIALTNRMPGRARENLAFREREGLSFAEHLLRANPADLTVHDSEHGRLLVPYYMRRPYDLLFVLGNTRPAYLYEASEAERAEIADALARGMRLMKSALSAIGREPAYNVVFHTGPGAGIHLEFLPRSQADGGFEQLGLSACQSSPERAAADLRTMSSTAP